MPPAVAPVIRSSSPTRAFGRFTLLRLIGKSEATMAWLALDSKTAAEMMLSMPRVPPAGAAGIGNWLLMARRAARLDHPNIATVAECGVHEHWPFVAVERRAGLTLDEWLAQHAHPGVDDAAGWVAGVLRGLAFGHDAGIAHLDLQLHNILVNERGQASVMALGVAPTDKLDRTDGTAPRKRPGRPAAIEPSALRAQRAAAERDVLACGVLLHRLADRRRRSCRAPTSPTSSSAWRRAAARSFACRGRRRSRSPSRCARSPTAAPRARCACAIATRAPSSARSPAGARRRPKTTAARSRCSSIGCAASATCRRCRGWRRGCSASRRSRASAPTRSRATSCPTWRLSFELLKTLSSARVQGTQIAGNGPVLTLRRVVSLIGVNGVRAAANGLRAWPGPLDDEGARALRVTIDRVRLAGHLAQALRPAGYDGEAVYLIAVLQSLGRLLLRYHFADEAEQIHQLMQPVPAGRGDGETTFAEQPGLDEEAAAFAVLGVDVEALGSAAARHWGLGEEVLHMIRRLPVDVPVRKPDTDDELLRIVASAANEAVDALELPAAKVSAALNAVVTRYTRTLRLTTRVLHDAVQDAKAALDGDGAAPSIGRGGRADTAEEADEAAPDAAPADATLDRQQHR